jgi:hypothetical protein
VFAVGKLGLVAKLGAIGGINAIVRTTTDDPTPSPLDLSNLPEVLRSPYAAAHPTPVPGAPGVTDPGMSGDDLLVLVLVVAYVSAFVVTRIRRYLHGRTLPPLVWEGTRAERRNSDLFWLAVPALIGLVISVPGTLGQLARGVTPWAIAWGVGCFVVLVSCWRLRRGDARELSLGDVARTTWDVATYTFRRTR